MINPNISTTDANNNGTTDVPFNNCTISISILNCTVDPDSSNNTCINKTVLVDNCTHTHANFDLLECINDTVKIYNCSNQINDTINCNNATITIPYDCFNGSNGVTPTTTIATTSNNPSGCAIPLNATSQPSIISSTMLLYFAVQRTESISVEDIIATLKNLQPPITLYTRCEKSSSETSSFNSTLSKVQPPTKVDLDLTAVENQSSISDSLKQTVNDAAAAAAAILLPSDTTTPAAG